jgi:hypothetical protein
MAGTRFQFAGVDLPLYGLTFDANFGEAQPSLVNMPGLNGAFNNHGSLPPPSVPGVVRLSFYLVASQRGEMQAKRDALLALKWQGRRVLRQILVDENGTETARWCEATVTTISAPQDIAGQTEYFQPVSMVFGVDRPVWKKHIYTAFWDDGTSRWNTSLVKWGGNADKATDVNGGNTFTISNGGSERALPILIVRCGAGQTVTNPQWEHMANGKKWADFYYNGTLVADDELIIDCQTLSVTLNGVGVYGDMVWTLKDEQWMYLYPGSNTIEVSWASDEVASTLVVYEEAYL